MNLERSFSLVLELEQIFIGDRNFPHTVLDKFDKIQGIYVRVD